MYLFIDSSTKEGALSKGITPSRKLFQLVVRLRKVEVEYGAMIQVSKVSGKRMISQGTGDGIFQGKINEGTATGISMLSFVPLHLSALYRMKCLGNWFKSWIDSDAEILAPSDWFTRGHSNDGGYNDDKDFGRVGKRNVKI
jgi:hypothetical protein